MRLYDFHERTSLSLRLRTLAAVLKNRTMVDVLSDLHEPDAFSALELLATSHEVIVLWLEDPAEAQAPPRGIFRAREAETGQRLIITRRTRLKTHERIRHALVDGGIEFLHLPIEEPVLPRVRHFLKDRKSLGHA